VSILPPLSHDNGLNHLYLHYSTSDFALPGRAGSARIRSSSAQEDYRGLHCPCYRPFILGRPLSFRGRMADVHNPSDRIGHQTARTWATPCHPSSPTDERSTAYRHHSGYSPHPNRRCLQAFTFARCLLLLLSERTFIHLRSRSGLHSHNYFYPSGSHI
jgi:hypothetical protein